MPNHQSIADSELDEDLKSIVGQAMARVYAHDDSIPEEKWVRIEEEAAAKINSHLHRQKHLSEWNGRVGEATWWHKNYQKPEYKELLAKRYQAMKERYTDLTEDNDG